MTIIEQLNRLAEIAPEVCWITHQSKSGAHYTIGDYTFFQHRIYGFMANLTDSTSPNATGRPALAWLRDALEGVIEARGWDYEHRFFAPIGNIGPRHKIMIMNGRDAGHITDTKAEALLTALIAALGGGEG